MKPSRKIHQRTESYASVWFPRPRSRGSIEGKTCRLRASSERELIVPKAVRQKLIPKIAWKCGRLSDSRTIPPALGTLRDEKPYVHRLPHCDPETPVQSQCPAGSVRSRGSNRKLVNVRRSRTAWESPGHRIGDGRLVGLQIERRSVHRIEGKSARVTTFGHLT